MLKTYLVDFNFLNFNYMRLKTLKKMAAFTLVELVIVIAIISLLAAIIVVAINPAATFQNARNAQRRNDIVTLRDAIARFLADSPSTASRPLYGAAGASCIVSGTPSAICNGGVTGAPTTPGLISGPGVGANGAYFSPPTGDCANGSTNSTNDTVARGWSIMPAATSTAGQISLENIVNNGYLPKVPTDPSSATTYYYMCIDTSNPSSGNNNTTPGKLVIYAPNAINDGLVQATVPYAVI